MISEVDLLLDNYRQWLLKMATVIAPGKPDLWQDLAQEGHVAMFRALKTYDETKGSLPSWLTTAAKLRMADVFRRDTWLGTPMRRGHTREHKALPVDIQDEHIIELLGHTSEVFDLVLTRYHDGDVLQALNQLTPKQREYVVLRFWKHYRESDLIEHFGYNPRSLWSGKDGAKYKLQESLSHLHPSTV